MTDEQDILDIPEDLRDIAFVTNLLSIVRIEGIDRQSGLRARQDALISLIKEYMFVIKKSNLIMKKNLTITDEEFIKYHMSNKLGEELIDNGAVGIKLERSSVEMKTVGIKLK